MKFRRAGREAFGVRFAFSHVSTALARLIKGPLCVCGLLFPAGFVASNSASAADNFWQLNPATGGSWFTAANWTDGTPTDDDQTGIANGGTVTIANLSAITDQLNLGPGTVQQSSGSLHVDDRLSIGAPDGGLAEY